MRSQLDTIWDMTPETYEHRQEIRRRRTQRTKRRERLYPLVTCVGIFAWAWICLWVAFA